MGVLLTISQTKHGGLLPGVPCFAFARMLTIFAMTPTPAPLSVSATARVRYGYAMVFLCSHSEWQVALVK